MVAVGPKSMAPGPEAAAKSSLVRALAGRDRRREVDQVWGSRGLDFQSPVRYPFLLTCLNVARALGVWVLSRFRSVTVQRGVLSCLTSCSVNVHRHHLSRAGGGVGPHSGGLGSHRLSSLFIHGPGRITATPQDSPQYLHPSIHQQSQPPILQILPNCLEEETSFPHNLFYPAGRRRLYNITSMLTFALFPVFARKATKRDGRESGHSVSYLSPLASLVDCNFFFLYLL